MAMITATTTYIFPILLMKSGASFWADNDRLNNRKIPEIKAVFFIFRTSFYLSKSWAKVGLIFKTAKHYLAFYCKSLLKTQKAEDNGFAFGLNNSFYPLCVYT